MKKTQPYLIALMVLTIFALSSCVTKKKYKIAEGHLSKLQMDSMSTHRLLTSCNDRVNSLEGDKSSLQAEKDALNGQKNSVQKDLNDLSNKSRMTIADQAKRLKDLQDLIQGQRDVMNKLKKTIADALINFKPDELSVYVKDGNVYVSLQEKLLFKSGSAVVDPKGKEALGNLASVLNNTPDINVLIEGHTDTIPIKNDKFEDNWALSSSRANSIVRVLTKDYGVDKHRITASGKAEFHPLQANDTDKGRAANRRTEIIITPNLSELFKLLDMQ